MQYMVQYKIKTVVFRLVLCAGRPLVHGKTVDPAVDLPDHEQCRM